jgi:hypothetical protein
VVMDPLAVGSLQDLVTFIRDELLPDLVEEREDWENRTVPDYLVALAAWLQSADGAYANQGLVVPDPPDWAFIAIALSTATDYE